MMNKLIIVAALELILNLAVRLFLNGYEYQVFLHWILWIIGIDVMFLIIILKRVK